MRLIVRLFFAAHFFHFHYFAFFAFLAFHLHFLMNRREGCWLLAVCIFSVTLSFQKQAGACVIPRMRDSTDSATRCLLHICWLLRVRSICLLILCALYIFPSLLLLLLPLLFCIGCCTSKFSQRIPHISFSASANVCACTPAALFNFFRTFCCKRYTSLITVLLISQHLKNFAALCFYCNGIFFHQRSSAFGDQ